MALNITIPAPTPLTVQLGNITTPGAITPAAGQATLADMLYNTYSQNLRTQLVKSATPRRIEIQGTASQPVFIAVGGRWGKATSTVFANSTLTGTGYMFAVVNADGTLALRLSASPTLGAFEMLLGTYSDSGSAISWLNPYVLGVTADSSGLVTVGGGGSGIVGIKGVTAFPASAPTGATIYRDDLGCWWRWDGGAWRQASDAYWTTASRPAAPPTDFRYVDLTDRKRYRYNGSAYVQASSAKLQLNYVASTTLWNGAVMTAGNTYGIGGVTQNFTVDDANSTVVITVSLSMFVGNSSGAVAQPYMAIAVDGTGRHGLGVPIYHANGTSQWYGGDATFALTGLSAGSHTLTPTITVDQTLSAYIIATSASSQYRYTMQVVEYYP